MATRDAFVTACWRGLLPTAHLLTGDPASARRLLSRALSVVRPVPGTDDRVAAVTALVRTHRSRWRPGGDGTIRSSAGAPWWMSPEDAAAADRLAVALDALTRDERTAVVLHGYEGWSAAQVEALVGGTDPAAAGARLRGEVPDPADLPDRLDGLAALCNLTGWDDDSVVAAVRARSVTRRRRTMLAAGTLTAVTAAVVWLPAVVPRPPVQPAAIADPTARPTATLRGIYAGPPRGNLADDGDLLAELQAALTASGDLGADYHLVYGADVDGIRAVLLVRLFGSQLRSVWLTGPAGTAPADLDMAPVVDPAGSTDAAAVVVPDAHGGPTEVVVVTAAGNRVAVSPGIDVDPVTGAGGRAFRDVPAPDGIATTRLDRPAIASVRFSVRSSTVLFARTDPTVGGPGGPAMSDGTAASSRSGAAWAPGFLHAVASSTVSSATGWGPGDVDLTVLGAGTFPAATGEIVQAVTVAAVLPSGAVVVTTGYGTQRSEVDGSVTSTWGTCGNTGYPAGTDLATLTVAATCSTTTDDYSTFYLTTVVAAPAGTQVTLNTAAGDTPVSPTLDRGWGYVSVPGQDFTTISTSVTQAPVAGTGNDVLTG